MNIVKLAGKPLGTNSKRRIKKFILKNIYFDRLVATYDTWVLENFPDALDILEQKKEAASFAYKPLISITVPTYNTPEEFLHECVGSVLTQTYDNWELVLVDDASPDPRVREIIKEYAEQDSRIKYKFLEKNHHIAGATNEAIKMSTGDYVGLFDHDDLLWPNALFEVVKALNADKEIDFLYTDEDKIVLDKSHHVEPFFKPDWSPLLLRTCNYITHFSVFKKSLLDEVGYEDGAYNGAQDWEMIMRATRNAKKVHHIAKVVYSWRVHDNSTAKTMESKPYVIDAQRGTIESDMLARGYAKDSFEVKQDSKYFAFWKTYVKDHATPKVSVVVPSPKQLKSIRRKTAYENCEFLYASDYNDALRQSTGEYIVFFEPNIYIGRKDWVEILLSDARQEDVGAAGGLTTYLNEKYIYSAGISTNQDDKLVRVLSGGVQSDNLKTLTRTVYVHTRRNTTALSGCVMVRKNNVVDFQFDTSEPASMQLVSLALELCSKGLNNVYNPEFVSVFRKRYVEKKKNTNQAVNNIYSDVEVDVPTRYRKHKEMLSRHYFNDDLVSYPDVDVL